MHKTPSPSSSAHLDVTPAPAATPPPARFDLGALLEQLAELGRALRSSFEGNSPALAALQERLGTLAGPVLGPPFGLAELLRFDPGHLSQLQAYLEELRPTVEAKLVELQAAVAFAEHTQHSVIVVPFPDR